MAALLFFAVWFGGAGALALLGAARNSKPISLLAIVWFLGIGWPIAAQVVGWTLDRG